MPEPYIILDGTAQPAPAEAPVLGGVNMARDPATGLYVPVALESAASPNLRVGVFGGASGAQVLTTTGDGTGTSGSALHVKAFAFGNNNGVWDRIRIASTFKAINAVAIGTEATIWTPAAGKKFRLMGFLLFTSVALASITLRDGTAGAIIALAPGNVAGIASPPMDNGILSAAANNVLTATGSAVGNLSGFVFGVEE